MDTETSTNNDIEKRLLNLLDSLPPADIIMITTKEGIPGTVERLLKTRDAVSIVNEALHDLQGQDYFTDFIRRFNDRETKTALTAMARILYWTQDLNALRRAAEIVDIYGSDPKRYSRGNRVDLIDIMGEVAKKYKNSKKFMDYLGNDF